MRGLHPEPPIVEPPPGELARASPEQLIRAAEKYARRCARERTDSKYIMHAATFLGPNERWRDFLTPEQRQQEPAAAAAGMAGAPNASAYQPVSAEAVREAVRRFREFYPDEYG